MRKEQVQIGGLYLAKVSGRVVPVRIDAVADGGGWWGLNIETHREVRIKTAARLRGKAPEPATHDRIRDDRERAFRAQDDDGPPELRKLLTLP